MRKIQIVPFGKMEEMRKMLLEYLTELSEFDPNIKFDEKGVPIYKWFDFYWTDKDRFPFYLIIDGEIAGLALIREMGNMHYDFAEFYVRSNFRKDGNSIWFAQEITNIFDGQFDFATRHSNPRAIKFWGKFAVMFENNSYIDDPIWRSWTIRKNNFKNYTMGLQKKYFNLIKNGEKVYEGRINSDSKKIINVGDTITFLKEPERTEELKAVVTEKIEFENFEQMAESLDKSKLGFSNSSKEEMIDVYRKIYNKEQEEKGVLVFKVKTIN